MWGRSLLLSVILVTAAAQNIKLSPNTFKNGVQHYLKYGDFTPEFRQLMRKLNLGQFFRSDAEPRKEQKLCYFCYGVVKLILILIRTGIMSLAELQGVLMALCMLAFDSEEVCYGTITSNIEIIWYIASARRNIPYDFICGLVFQSYGCLGTPACDWNIDIPEGVSDINKGIVSDEVPIKVLHLTDIHLDGLYAPGSLANCNLPVCCTAGTVPKVEKDAAGCWGDFRSCDTPLHVIDDALNHIAAQHPDIDCVYYSGDTVSHRVWGTSIKNNTQDITLIVDKLAAAFPNVPIYHALGNHEPHPLNAFAPHEVTNPSLSTQWLFNLFADLCSPWLEEDALVTLRKGGFYTQLIRPGFRLVVLNSNVANTFNWWLLFDDVDPYGQLAWLVNVLFKAEEDGEKVHILSHIPSSELTTYKVWSREYRRVIDRFAGTIAATFNGHSHRDELILYHSISEPRKPINVAWNGGSLTTYSNKNPNYKIFEIDARSYEVLDFDVWSYNITCANLNRDISPAWYKLYSFKKAYGLSGAAPEDVRELAIKFSQDRNLIEQYFRFTVKFADSALESGCDDECLRSHLCDLLRSEVLDTKQCSELAPKW